MQTMTQPTLADKVGAAIYVMSMWPELPGVRTINTLMWPYQVPPLLPREEPAASAAQGPWIAEPADVRRQAAKVLASACTALLEGVPQPRIEQIWTAQAGYLSSALEPQPRGDRSPMWREGVLHPPQNRGEWLAAFSGLGHRCQPDT